MFSYSLIIRLVDEILANVQLLHKESNNIYPVQCKSKETYLDPSVNLYGVFDIKFLYPSVLSVIFVISIGSFEADDFISQKANS